MNAEWPPDTESGRAAPRVSPGRMVARALARRCPLCGARDIFLAWFRLADDCTQCGLRLNRNEDADYWTGGYLLNFIAAELIVVLFMTAVIAVAWPDVPWNGVLYGTAAAAILGPLLTFPFAKTLWLAIDLVFRPPELQDFVPPKGPHAIRSPT